MTLDFIGGNIYFVQITCAKCLVKFLEKKTLCDACWVVMNHAKNTEDFVLTYLFLFPAPAAAPQNPSSTTLNDTAILVQWEEVPDINRNGIITSYEVRIDPAQFQNVRYETVTGSELVLVVDGLEEFVKYNFTIRAYTIAGPGPFSVITVSTTHQAGKVNVL